jgi:Ca2+-binding RTX toxin-like protein
VSKSLKTNTVTDGPLLASTGDVTDGMRIDGITVTGEVLGGPLDHWAHLKGTSGNDYIVGGEYRDRIIGGPGDDILTGGGGHDGFDPGDVFVFKPGSDQDVITDFHGADQINIAAFLKAGDHISVGDCTMGAIIDLGTGDTITLLGVSSSHLVQTSFGFVFSPGG